ncbi:hypothetical protein CR513_16671, partial [Mucuna pruriens]
MENNDRTLKELATPDVVYQPWCIQYPQLEPAQTYELKSGLIHLLPKFHGLAGEDPHKHLKEFHVVCSTMRPQGISEDYIKMKAFPFSLDGAAKDWLYLQPVLFNTWGDMKRTFLEKFFPTSRTASIRKEICGIRQHTGETLHEYWERFNKLCATCPHHQISEQLLIQYFYEGLSMMDRSMIDAASGGALMDKTPAAARHLISNMASNTQQFGIRGPNQPRMVNEIGAASNQRLENQLTELTSLVRQLAVGQHQPAMAAKVCGICTSVEHPTDMCPTLQETESDQPENVGAIGGFQYGKQPYQNRPFDNQQHGKQPFRPGPNQGPYATQQFGSTPNTYQRQAGYQQPTPQYPAPPFQQQQQQQRVPTQGNSPSLEDLMKQLATNNLEFQQSVSSSNLQFQQNMTATIQDLKTQIGQLANTVSQMQSAGSSNLPSQTIPNPRGNASVVTLRSGRELPQPTLQQLPRPAEADSEPNADLQSRPETTVPLPFPSRTLSARKPESDEELLKMFRKVEINIPLLDAIKQVPKYAKFLKELCVHKRRKIKGSKENGGVVSTLTKNEAITADAPTLPKKCRDPGIFSVPCTIGECTFADAMLDLGASINVMPASIYRSLNFCHLEPIGMTIQLANRIIVQPLDVLEDVLVQVNELIFLADFYVLDMKDETSGKESTLILGRSFLMTARTKIDVHAGMLSMEFGDTLVQFNIFEAMKHPTEDHSLFGIDVLDELVEEYLQLNGSSENIEESAENAESSCLEVTDKEADHEEVPDLPNSEPNSNDIVDLTFEEELSELLDQSDPNSGTEKSPLPPPPIELKTLPSHLKYAYLDKEQQLPVIIASNLDQEQEDKLLEVLRQHKKAIGWKLADLPGINPSICMHRILMEEEIKPIRQPQRRLNPTLLDVMSWYQQGFRTAGECVSTTFQNIFNNSSSDFGFLVEVVRDGNGNGTVVSGRDCKLTFGSKSDSADLGNCCNALSAVVVAVAVGKVVLDIAESAVDNLLASDRYSVWIRIVELRMAPDSVLAEMAASHVAGYQMADSDTTVSRTEIHLWLQRSLFGPTRFLEEWGTYQWGAPRKYICHIPSLPWLVGVVQLQAVSPMMSIRLADSPVSDWELHRFHSSFELGIHLHLTWHTKTQKDLCPQQRRQFHKARQAELTKINRRVSSETKSSRPSQIRLGNPCFAAQQPNKERPNCVVHVSYPPQRQLSCHVTLRESATSRWKIFIGRHLAAQLVYI